MSFSNFQEKCLQVGRYKGSLASSLCDKNRGMIDGQWLTMLIVFSSQRLLTNFKSKRQWGSKLLTIEDILFPVSDDWLISFSHLEWSKSWEFSQTLGPLLKVLSKAKNSHVLFFLSQSISPLTSFFSCAPKILKLNARRILQSLSSWELFFFLALMIDWLTICVLNIGFQRCEFWTLLLMLSRPSKLSFYFASKKSAPLCSSIPNVVSFVQTESRFMSFSTVHIIGFWWWPLVQSWYW